MPSITCRKRTLFIVKLVSKKGRRSGTKTISSYFSCKHVIKLLKRFTIFPWKLLFKLWWCVTMPRPGSTVLLAVSRWRYSFVRIIIVLKTQLFVDVLFPIIIACLINIAFLESCQSIKLIWNDSFFYFQWPLVIMLFWFSFRTKQATTNYSTLRLISCFAWTHLILRQIHSSLNVWLIGCCNHNLP